MPKSHDASEEFSDFAEGKMPDQADFKERAPNINEIERAHRLKQAVREAGGNAAVSARAGIPLRSLGNFLAGRDPRSAELVALADACDVTVEWLATGRPPRRRPAEGEAAELEKVTSFREGPHLQAPHRGENSKYSVPFSFNVNSSGHLDYKSRQIVETFNFDTAWLIETLKVSPNSIFLVNIWDNDLAPAFSLGDTVLIDTSRRETRVGDVYAIAIDDRIMLRRLALVSGEGLALTDDNNASPPIEVEEGKPFPLYFDGQRILYLGRVVWHARSV